MHSFGVPRLRARRSSLCWEARSHTNSRRRSTFSHLSLTMVYAAGISDGGSPLAIHGHAKSCRGTTGCASVFSCHESFLNSVELVACWKRWLASNLLLHRQVG